MSTNSESKDIRKKYRNIKSQFPAAEDTTVLGVSAEKMTPGFLRFVGELLFGERWQVPLAAHLTQVRGRPVTQARLHQWMTLERPIQSWVYEALGAVVQRQATELARKAEVTTELGRRMADPSAAALHYENWKSDQEWLTNAS